MADYIPYIQLFAVIFIFIFLVVEKFQNHRMHDAHVNVILNLLEMIKEFNIKMAIVDLQLGNTTYKAVKSLIHESRLIKCKEALFNQNLEQLAQEYNLNKDI